MYIEFAISPIQEQLRSLNDGTIAGLSDQAAKANERARKLETEAGALRKQAVSLLKDVALANARAAEATSMAKSAELARAELEARIAPRTLNLAQREYIGRALSRFAISFFGRKVRIHWQPNDGEATVFGVEIRDALLRANLQVETNADFIIGSNGYGVRITGTGPDRPFIESLYGLLRIDTGSELTWEVNPKYLGSPVSIEVATKPPLGLDTLGQMLPVPVEPKPK